MDPNNEPPITRPTIRPSTSPDPDHLHWCRRRLGTFRRYASSTAKPVATVTVPPVTKTTTPSSSSDSTTDETSQTTTTTLYTPPTSVATTTTTTCTTTPSGQTTCN